MARNAPKSQWQTLRRYAQSGQMDATRRMLQRMVERYPQDTEAAAELARLRAGQALHIAETPAARQERLRAEALQGIEGIISAAAYRKLTALRTAELTHLHRNLLSYLSTLQEQRTPAPLGTNACKNAIDQELTRRRKRRRRALGLSVAAALLVAGILGGTALLLRNRASELTERLHTAYQQADWQAGAALLEAADTGINRLLYPASQSVIITVKNWQRTASARAKELATHLERYEKRSSIADLSLEERAIFLRHLRSLPHTLAAPLLARWEQLCIPEKQMLEAQKMAVLSELADADQLPELSGRVDEDIQLLRKSEEKQGHLIRNFAHAKDAFDLEPSLISPIEALLKRNSQMLNEAVSLSQLGAKLQSAVDYEQYRRVLLGFTPGLYAPACQIARQIPRLPDAEQINAEVRALRHNLPTVIPEPVRKAIISRGPSFEQDYPASQEQVHLMEDIFSAHSLRQGLFRVSNMNGITHFSDSRPIITEKNSVVFSLSKLDPAFHIGQQQRLEWAPSQTVAISWLDPSALLQATGITRSHFFLSGNLPHLLGVITGVQAKECPALAKAYLYHTILELMRLHKRPEILGIRFSPMLQEDTASFRKLQETLAYPLSISCWLRNTPESRAAEEGYSRWFAEHAKRDYSAEMSRALGRILREKTRYIGYVDAEGRTRYKGESGSTLWYYSGGKMRSVSANNHPESPDPFTPILSD